MATSKEEALARFLKARQQKRECIARLEKSTASPRLVECL